MRASSSRFDGRSSRATRRTSPTISPFERVSAWIARSRSARMFARISGSAMITAEPVSPIANAIRSAIRRVSTTGCRSHALTPSRGVS